MVNHYVMNWRRDTSGECSDSDSHYASITGGSTSYNITGLEEDSSYSITMRASISIASTEVSNPATVMTLEAGERELLQVHVTRIYILVRSCIHNCYSHTCICTNNSTCIYISLVLRPSHYVHLLYT